MARKLDQNVPDIGAPDAQRPDGYYLNEDAGIPGTPILAELKNDAYYYFSRMMTEAGIAYNNFTDNIESSQYYTALEKNILKYSDLTVVGLASIPGREGFDLAFPQGFSSVGDGGGGSYFWDDTSTDDPISGIIIEVVGTLTGRWKKIYSGAINVLCTGMKNDGSADISTLLTELIDNDFLDIYFPDGNYLLSNGVSKAVSPAVRTNLRGESKEGTKITFNGTSESAIGGLFNVFDLTLDGTGSTNSTGLDISNFTTPGNFTGEQFFKDLVIQNFQYGTKIDSVFIVHFEDCFIQNNEYGIEGALPGSDYRTTLTFTRCTIRVNNKLGVNLTGGAITSPNIKFISCSIERNALDGTFDYQLFASKTSPLSFDNCYFERLAGSGDPQVPWGKFDSCTVLCTDCYDNDTLGIDLVGSAAVNRLTLQNYYATQPTTFIDADSNSYIVISDGSRLDGVNLTNLANAGTYLLSQCRIGGLEYGEYSSNNDKRNRGNFNSFNNIITTKALTPSYTNEFSAATRTDITTGSPNNVLQFDIPSNGFKCFTFAYVCRYFSGGSLFRTAEYGEITFMAGDVGGVDTVEFDIKNTKQIGGGAYTLSLVFTSNVTAGVATLRVTPTVGQSIDALNISFVPLAGFDPSGVNVITQV